MIILMGPAGSGKGTQAKLLVEKDNYFLISTGDLLRNSASDDQKARMLAGVLLDDAEIFALIEQVLSQVPDLKKCIMDGTPRSIPQAEWLMKQVQAGRFVIEAVIHLEVSDAVVKQRLLARGRSDDTDAGIQKRLAEYQRSTVPILDYFKAQGVAVHSINGEQDADAVHAAIVQVLEVE